jgi:hypothetical protein
MVLQRPTHSIAIPGLESGDRLTRAEFERRYQSTPEKFKAEPIEGVVYVASPVRAFHGNPMQLLYRNCQGDHRALLLNYHRLFWL